MKLVPIRIGRMIEGQHQRATELLAESEEAGEVQEIIRRIGWEIVTDGAEAPSDGFAVAHRGSLKTRDACIIRQQHIPSRLVHDEIAAARSEERRVGKERSCRGRRAEVMS